MISKERSIILVEDEPVIAVMIEDVATDLGWDVDGIAHSERAAFDLLDGSRPTVAVLDINLGLTTSFAIASACRDRRIPVLFITGYSASEVPEACGEAPVLFKPFSPVDFDRALTRCLSEPTMSIS